jgi:hypothetical protein
MSGRRWMARMAIDPMPPVAQTATRNGLPAVFAIVGSPKVAM